MANDFTEITRRDGAPAVFVTHVAHGGYAVPAGPVTLLVPAWVAAVVAEPLDVPAVVDADDDRDAEE